MILIKNMIRCLTTASNSRIIESDLKKINLIRSISLIDVTDPSIKDIREIHERFKIPIIDINSCLDPHESPRIKYTKDYTLIIYNQVFDKDGSKRFSPIGFFLTKKCLISIHLDKIKFIDELDLESKITKDMFHAGTEIILFKILYSLIKDIHKTIQEIEERLELVEDYVLEAYDQKVMHKIYAIKNILLYVRKSLVGNKGVLEGIVKDSPQIKQKSLFAELDVELMQLLDMSSIFRERLTSILEIYMTTISNKINIIMKYFTVIASVLLLPMLITGLYGMNVLLPFQKHAQAFWIVLGIIIVSIALMISFFKSKKWL